MEVLCSWHQKPVSERLLDLQYSLSRHNTSTTPYNQELQGFIQGGGLESPPPPQAKSSCSIIRAVCRNFSKGGGGKFGVRTKEGGRKLM